MHIICACFLGSGTVLSHSLSNPVQSLGDFNSPRGTHQHVWVRALPAHCQFEGCVRPAAASSVGACAAHRSSESLVRSSHDKVAIARPAGATPRTHARTQRLQDSVADGRPAAGRRHHVGHRGLAGQRNQRHRDIPHPLHQRYGGGAVPVGTWVPTGHLARW